jgi:hypothetical protein
MPRPRTCPDVITSTLNKHHRAVVLGFFFSFFLIGIITFPDYGISFDEPVSRTNGGISLRYVLDRLHAPIFLSDAILALQNIPLMQYQDRDYGVSFDMPAFFIERLLALNDSRSQYLLRHLLTFIVFFLGVLASYKLASDYFEDWRFGLLAAIILVTSPRIYGEAFYNNKDIVFMSLISICMYTAWRLNGSLSWHWAILHAIASALAITVRIPGLIFPLLTACALTALLISKAISFKKYVFLGTIYAITTCLAALAFWPWLWENPVAHALQAFQSMARFRWDHYNLYFGQFVSARDLPWHYASIWIAITTPIFFIGFSLLGLGKIVLQSARSTPRYLLTVKGIHDFTALGISVGPVLITSLLNSTLYDGWRQLYFVYPGIVFLAVKGAQALSQVRFSNYQTSSAVAALLALQIVINICWMIKWHPYQYVYFNSFVSDAAKQRFEWDYWGVTNFDGLRYILTADARSDITVAPLGATALTQAISLLPANDRPRILSSVISSKPDYLITNYRFFDASVFKRVPLDYERYHSITVDGREVLTIYKRVTD